MTITQHQIAVLAENERLKKEIQIMREIGSADGFYNYYFGLIPFHKSRIDAFNQANDLHQKYFGEKRYRNYYSFKNVINRKLK